MIIRGDRLVFWAFVAVVWLVALLWLVPMGPVWW